MSNIFSFFLYQGDPPQFSEVGSPRTRLDQKNISGNAEEMDKFQPIQDKSKFFR